jgi:hypothetical protein
LFLGEYEKVDKIDIIFGEQLWAFSYYLLLNLLFKFKERDWEMSRDYDCSIWTCGANFL